jgi:hypothetical protein
MFVKWITRKVYRFRVLHYASLKDGQLWKFVLYIKSNKNVQENSAGPTRLNYLVSIIIVYKSSHK